MHAPWVQIEMEVIELSAPHLAIELDWDENAALGGLVRMIRWALKRCPDDRPPSASEVVEGPGAAKHLARSAGWQGDPGAFVRACSAIRPDPILEPVEGGIRVCGLKRYDALWKKNRPKTDADQNLNRPETGAEPVRQNQNQIQSQKEDQLPPPPRSRAGEAKQPQSGGGEDQDLGEGEQLPTAQDAWELLQEIRTGKARWKSPDGLRVEYLERETERPPGFNDWWNAEGAKRAGAMITAYQKFLGDEHFADRQWPMAIFMRPKVWKVRL